METSPSNSHSTRSDGPPSYNSLGSYNRQDDEMGLLRTKYKQSNNKVYHDFHKTKMCSLYNLNICKKGKDCPFAHSDDEIRDKPNLFKTKLCDAFLQGQCNKGEECSFAHGEEELRSTPDLFKTAICNLWTQGKCTAGEVCRFAHGYDDLRPAPSHHKFKKKSYNKGQQQKTPYPQNNYYNNQQYPYPPNIYSYPMYPMPMMPGDMQNPYMMTQPFGFQGGMHPSMRNQ